MFLRIFRYRVKPQMRDRHLAAQARAARLYEQYVRHAPKYFRRSGDVDSWVELHWYEDKAECQRVADMVADDPELTRLWRDFQETLDGDYPSTLEEFGEYELPRPVNASPFSQPPIDAPSEHRQPPEPPPEVAPPPVQQESTAPSSPPAPPADPPVAAEVVDARDETPLRPDVAADDPNADPARRGADNGEVKDCHDERCGVEAREDADNAAHYRAAWPQPPIPPEDAQADDDVEDELIVEDDAPNEPPPSKSLSFNDGVWIVDPNDRPGSSRGENG